ncbi:hypothetical protein AB7C87_19925 [Natrarchaeobius sp. A-rgal3]|uniref:hypothetical protein n=1 Tax=Natrarchaeobius versutus TaxID=1679078 RepID=UPI00350FD233
MIERDLEKGFSPAYHILQFLNSATGELEAQFFEKDPVAIPDVGCAVSLGEIDGVNDDGLEYDSEKKFEVEDVEYRYDLAKDVDEKDRLIVRVTVTVSLRE